MAVREIVYCGDPVLRETARRVRRINDEIIQLLDDLSETMLKANGLGLAAEQLGATDAVVVVRGGPETDDFIELINPRIVEREGEQEGAEGCLSLPTLRGTVLRPNRVVVEAVDRDGEDIVVEGEELIARCLAHELDHLEGRLFIDLVEEDSLSWMRPDEDEPGGYRFESTTLEEAREAFDRLRKQQRRDSE